MKSIHNVGAVIAVALGLTMGCGATSEGTTGESGAASPQTADAEPGTVESEGVDTVAASNVEVVHDFDVSGTHYTIIDSDGDLLTIFNRPRSAPIAVVVAANGEELTLLEMYTALQPEGVPDQRLVDAHIQGVQQLGRPDASIHAASLQLNTTVEKTFQEECITAAAGYTGGTFSQPFYTRSGLISTTNGTFNAARTAQGEKGDMLLLACNYRATAQTETVEFHRRKLPNSWTVDYSTSITQNSTSGIIQNTGNGVTKYDLRAKVTTFPNQPMVIGVFAEAR
jgi:hypothetical protein